MQEEIKIEKNIPLSSHWRTSNGGYEKILSSCEIGDSFELKRDKIISGIYVTAKKLGIRVAGRKTQDGYRFWRIA